MTEEPLGVLGTRKARPMNDWVGGAPEPHHVDNTAYAVPGELVSTPIHVLHCAVCLMVDPEDGAPEVAVTIWNGQALCVEHFIDRRKEHFDE
jgi:hypothetical protein